MVSDMVTSAGDMAFVSHANPEDNDFSLWLTLQLAKRGYRVWCDLTRLLGGEDFWSDIESAIREGTSKFLYVLSQDSNHKPGPLQELNVALSVAKQRELRDFVIPLRIDSLPYQDINIQLSRLNAIDFSAGWASGLSRLIEKLEHDCVRKDPRFSPSSIASWWSRSGNPGQSVLQSPEEYVSNWFAIESLPDVVYLHSLPPFVRFDDLKVLPFPFRKVGNLLVCFANPGDVNQYLGNGVRVLSTWEENPMAFLAGVAEEVVIGAEEAHRVLVHLLKRGWWQLSRSAGMYEHRVRQSSDFYLPLGKIRKNRVAVPPIAGGSRMRSLVGYRSVGRDEGEERRRYWHFAVSARVEFQPFPMYQLIPHIVFSTDGRNILSDSSSAHRYRRSQGKNWWNPHWRDRTLGLVWWLATQSSHFLVPLGPSASAKVSSLPVSFRSPVSYEEPGRT